MLQLALGAVAVVAVVSLAASTWIASSLGAQEDELARQISERRAAIRAGSDGGDRSPVALLDAASTRRRPASSPWRR